MGQEVKNPLRAQSKYGLMGSSAKTGKKIFEGHRSTFWIKMPFGIGHPHLHMNCSLHVLGRAQGSQIFKRNSIISIHSKVMAFLVILLSPHGPRCPRVVPVVPTSSLSSPHCPHIICVIPTLSASSLSSSCCPHSPQKVPMWSPWSVVPTSSLSSPCHLCVIPIIPTSSRRSPHHPYYPRYPLHPSSTLLGGGRPGISKNARQFVIIKIF